MPRPRQRVCLEHGLKLDINKLAREGLLQPGARAFCTYSWTNSHTGELTASAQIIAQLQTERAGWFRIQMGDLDQWIDLVAQPRHFGGRQWYFRSSPPSRLFSVYGGSAAGAFAAASMGRPGRVRLAVRDPGGSGASRESEDQRLLARRPLSR